MELGHYHFIILLFICSFAIIYFTDQTVLDDETSGWLVGVRACVRSFVERCSLGTADGIHCTYTVLVLVGLLACSWLAAGLLLLLLLRCGSVVRLEKSVHCVWIVALCSCPFCLFLAFHCRTTLSACFCDRRPTPVRGDVSTTVHKRSNVGENSTTACLVARAK